MSQDPFCRLKSDPDRSPTRVDRRGFLHLAASLSGMALVIGPSRLHGAGAGGELRVGFIGLLNDAGSAARRGAELGAGEAAQAAELLGERFQVRFAAAADAGGAVAEAVRMIEDHGIFGVVGGFDPSTARALADVADHHDVLFLNAGCSDDELRGAQCRRTTFHVAASDRMRRDALALWRRESADPAPDAAGAVELWHPELERFGAGQLNDRFHSRFAAPLQPAGWASWMAVKVLWESAARARTPEAGALVRFLEGGRARFDGHKGMPLSFRPQDHQLRQPLYIVDGGTAAALLDEVPRAQRGGERGWDELLDQLGSADDAAGCGAPALNP